MAKSFAGKRTRGSRGGAQFSRSMKQRDAAKKRRAASPRKRNPRQQGDHPARAPYKSTTRASRRKSGAKKRAARRSPIAVKREYWK